MRRRAPPRRGSPRSVSAARLGGRAGDLGVLVGVAQRRVVVLVRLAGELVLVGLALGADPALVVHGFGVVHGISSDRGWRQVYPPGYGWRHGAALRRGRRVRAGAGADDVR